MANTFGTDILIQSPDPKSAAAFYVKHLGFTITGETPMLSLHGQHINFFIEKGPALGPVLEVTVENVEKAKAQTGKKRLQDSQRRAPGSQGLHPRPLRLDLQPDHLAVVLPIPCGADTLVRCP